MNEIRIVDFDGDCYLSDEFEDMGLTELLDDVMMFDIASDEEMYDDVD